MPREVYPGLLTVTLVLLFATLLRPVRSGSRHPPCKEGIEYRSTENQQCAPCTKCPPELIIKPCAARKDAICGPTNETSTRNWSLSTKKRPRVTSTVASKIVFQDELKDEQEDFPQEEDEDNYASEEVMITNDPRERRRSSLDTSLPWDWQTGALVLAVCACVVFFMVAGCSALVYARQWRQMKKNFEPAGLEEISTRLNLMVKAELAEFAAGAPMCPGDPETRCQYLEKLLDRKRETPVVAGWPEVGSNLYIEEGETPSSRQAQIARIHRNIESILSHKPIELE